MRKVIRFDSPCPYLPNRIFRREVFFETSIRDDDWDELLSQGWRHFGSVFFRPQCPGCRACIPLRVLVQELSPTASQRRVLKKNRDTRVEFVSENPDEEVYRIYKEHKEFRFNHEADQENKDYETFLSSFNLQVTSGLLSKYYVDHRLAAVGFLDVTPSAFSSIYFVYRHEYRHLSLGTYSVFAEVQEALRRGLTYYYLGYWISENHFMNYKANFKPHEIMNWNHNKWERPPQQPANRTPLSQ